MREADAPSPKSGRGHSGHASAARLRLSVALLTALGATLLAAPSAFALTSNYAIGVPVCKAPTLGHKTCFAVRRQVVSKGTAGARPFVRGAGVAPSISTIGPAGGLTPADLATAYGFTSTATVTQTVAIVDAFNDPNINADLQTFDKQYGLAACSTANACLKVVGQTGSTTALPPNDTTGWSVEESLDVESVHSVCQKCKIILVEATSNSNPNLEAAEKEAVALKATEISNSFGGPEQGSTATDEAAYNHPGIVITASSGDDGYFNWDQANDGISSANAPNAPASYNTVVAVGGTSLNLGQTATRQSETVWNDNGPKDYWATNFGQSLGAGGGGCSTLIAGQLWQTHVANWASTVCGTHRLVADVSAVADYLTGFDVLDSYDPSTCNGCLTGWNTIGGTSLASPVIASMWGLDGGAHGVKYPSLNLYGHVGTASLYDVTVGGNGYCDGIGAANCGNPNTLGAGVLDCDYPATGTTPSTGDRACDALAGYDGPTGVGTPNGLTALSPVHPTVKIAGPTTIVHNTTGTWTATVTDPTPGATVSSYKWNWGDATAVTSTTTGSATHKYTAAATRTITLTITDSDGQTGTATYSVKVT
jgi:subtilase family serine protease